MSWEGIALLVTLVLVARRADWLELWRALRESIAGAPDWDRRDEFSESRTVRRG